MLVAFKLYISEGLFFRHFNNNIRCTYEVSLVPHLVGQARHGWRQKVFNWKKGITCRRFELEWFSSTKWSDNRLSVVWLSYWLHPIFLHQRFRLNTHPFLHSTLTPWWDIPIIAAQQLVGNLLFEIWVLCTDKCTSQSIICFWQLCNPSTRHCDLYAAVFILQNSLHFLPDPTSTPPHIQFGMSKCWTLKMDPEHPMNIWRFPISRILWCGSKVLEATWPSV